MFSRSLFRNVISRKCVCPSVKRMISYTFNGFPMRFIALLYCVLPSYFIVPRLFVLLISLRPPFGGMSCGTIPGGRATLPKWAK